MKNHIVSLLLASALALPSMALADPARFDTLEEASAAFRNALRSKGSDELLAVFGDDAADVLSSGDPVEDRANRLALVLLAGEAMGLAPNNDGSVSITLGRDDWAFPIPLVLTEGAWSFDIAAGTEEINARRIGRNELDVIELLDAYVDIQAEFRLNDHDGDGVMEFARHIISDPDLRDGLVWAEPDSPMGVLLAQASLDGFNDGEEDRAPIPHSGYYFRILTEQTAAAPGGERSYLMGGDMVAGHAILAVPAIYGETGRVSFMVSENGRILEADLGPGTLDLVADWTAYDPTDQWGDVTD